ncbi:hypothetical protein DM877_08005 [Enterobacter cloacae]|uniref:Uncharacterized protein n=1 Tax=Enterobacter cloacae TaxID=550 RepID=A0A4Q2EB28_ENTCL|nr:hypothetical protein DM877_08005 [Enterobacter cloacae]
MIMMVFVINQKKAANNNLFGNVKVIHKYNFRSSFTADIDLRADPRSDKIGSFYGYCVSKN